MMPVPTDKRGTHMRGITCHRASKDAAQINKTQGIHIACDKPENENPSGGNRDRENGGGHYCDREAIDG
ncbi:hypothetical protein AA12717_0422 [Gluconacetobacter sacchari DSM 12717]|uniref:Uncharacterized protein n=1 Tax=Gluconacetobacter sacchari DSM 12717 TaxID=1307940 RepID=A0ABQ0P2R8_9PROT|nr:hypothetical protein AA12717_0422 [Gluconacetobacter sacchari DSM 12717]